MTRDNHINIRPTVSILSVLRHLNYKPWYALAEFVDNSLQSYIQNIDELRALYGNDYILKVSIKLDTSGSGTRMTIRDNAGGIKWDDYSRAFRPAALPPDRTGLSEFGMGMKSAACWFSPKWTVRTSALGENVERRISFDVEQIVNDSIEELDIEETNADKDTHFTELILDNLYKPPQGRTIGKMKTHLASIYRIFIREKRLQLFFDGDQLVYAEPGILTASYYKETDRPAKTWKKSIDFDFGQGLRVHGFAILRQTGSTSEAGFALFRRNRVIEGSGDDGYRPEYIFRKSNSYTYQRLAGELHLEGFDVSHTKDGFRWGENEQPFLELLKEYLDEEPLPLLKQAEGYRARLQTKKYKPPAKAAVNNTTDSIEQNLTSSYTNQFKQEPDETPPPQQLPTIDEDDAIVTRDVRVVIDNQNWAIKVELSNDPAVGDWVELTDKLSTTADGELRTIGIRLNLAHPFMIRFGGIDTDPMRLEAILRIACALVLGEISARESGVRAAGTIRRNINQLLRDTFSKS